MCWHGPGPSLMNMSNRYQIWPDLGIGVVSSRLWRPGPASRIFFITGSPQNRGDSLYIEGTGPLGGERCASLPNSTKRLFAKREGPSEHDGYYNLVDRGSGI